MRSIFIIFVLLFTVSAQAIPVSWTLSASSNTWYTNAYGTFTYDADTNVYSNINLTTNSASGYFDDYLPDTVAIAKSDFLRTDGFCGIGPCWLALSFGDALTNAGGTVSLVPSSFVRNLDTDGIASLAGSVSASNVPVPAAVWLFGSALAGLGWIRRTQIV